MATAPTLDDVAKYAGVSTATVSRCLNTPDRVVEKTRDRVMAAVEALGYTPNFGARVMAAKRTFTIGAIIPTMENAIFARGLQAFQETLYGQGYTLLVASSAYDPQIEQEQIRALVARGADGLLLIGQDRDAAVYDYLERQQVPTLIAWTFAPDARLSTVGFDNRAAMETLAQVVLEKGHRRIGLISAPVAGNDRARERVEGVRLALAASSLAEDALTVLEAPYDVERGAAAFEQLMTLPRPPSVVMCGNDVQAAGAVMRARQMGLRVPQDVSVTGFDDMEIARLTHPALTSVTVPHREMGRQAAETLVKMVTGAEATHTRLETRVVERGSLGPV